MNHTSIHCMACILKVLENNLPKYYILPGQIFSIALQSLVLA